MTSLFTVDVGHLSGNQQGLLESKRFEQIARKKNHGAVFEQFRKQLATRDYPLATPFRDEESTVRGVRAVARALRGKYSDTLLIGIGGSTLGARALLNALRGPFYNMFCDTGRLFVLDNIDPFVSAELLERLDLSKTLVIYASKSGSTPEPAANFMAFLHEYKRRGADTRDIVVICDKAENDINRLAAELACHLLHIPAELPGRYSVLSPVGLLPAELLGIDCADLLAGARACRDRVQTIGAPDNPCYVLASAFQVYAEMGKKVHFLFSYSNLLAEFNLWFLQLWSESLGKRLDLEGSEVREGEMPTVGIGATDQHSVLQMLKEGPLDKVVGFINLKRSLKDVTIPDELAGYVEYDYLKGHTLSELLEKERLSTELSLYASGTPCYRISLERLDAVSLGALFYFWELIVAYMAALKNVDPFNQPGVRRGKEMTYTLMGRKDFAHLQEQETTALEEYLRQSRILSL